MAKKGYDPTKTQIFEQESLDLEHDERRTRVWARVQRYDKGDVKVNVQIYVWSDRDDNFIPSFAHKAVSYHPSLFCKLFRKTSFPNTFAYLREKGLVEGKVDRDHVDRETVSEVRKKKKTEH